MDIFTLQNLKSRLNIKSPQFLIRLGLILMAFSLLFLLVIFYPVILLELSYYFNKGRDGLVVINEGATAVQFSKTIQPVDEQFGIVIPKIRANAKVIADVDPYDEKVYQRALTLGVAHAKGSVYPGQAGNVFIFSHSSVNFYEANRYNSVFYLLNKMEKGDDIYLFYQGEKFIYKVGDKKVIEADDLAYLNQKTVEKTLTLMTCWPPGTTLRRLIVNANLD